MKNILSILLFCIFLLSCSGDKNDNIISETVIPIINDTTTTIYEKTYTRDDIEPMVDHLYNIDNIEDYKEYNSNFFKYHWELMVQNRNNPVRDFLIIRADDKESVEKERLLWDNQNIKNYQYTYKISSNPPVGPNRVTIRENEEPIVEKLGFDNGFYTYKDISGIYDKFISMIFGSIIEFDTNSNSSLFGPEIIIFKIFYDREYHYPKMIYYSVYYPTFIAGGSGFVFEMIDFKIID